jgi:hypothetical protein
VSSKQLAELPEIKQVLDRDLKANLLSLKFLMEDKEGLQKIIDSRTLTTLKNSINTLLSDILHQQVRAVGRMDHMELSAVFEYEKDAKSSCLEIRPEEKQCPQGHRQGQGRNG